MACYFPSYLTTHLSFSNQGNQSKPANDCLGISLDGVSHTICMFISFVGVAEFLRTVSSFEIRKQKVKSKKKDKAHGASTIQMALSKGDTHGWRL